MPLDHRSYLRRWSCASLRLCLSVPERSRPPRRGFEHLRLHARAQQVDRLVMVKRVVRGEQPVVGRFGP